MQERISRFEHIDKTKFCGSRHDYQLTLLGTSMVESGGSVGKLKRNAQPLFKGESPGLLNLLLCQHVTKLAGTPRSIQTGNRGCGFQFHSAILHGNDMPVTA